jgi:Mn2+/Fe2+ NRAMP family transporter
MFLLSNGKQRQAPGHSEGGYAALAGVLKAGRNRLRQHPLAKVGPGLITGVADDDPSGIATYSQAGAQYGLGMLWTMPLALPLMAAVQLMCASIGRVTGKGLAANIRNTFPPTVLYGIVFLLLVANVCNIAADVAVMGEVAELVIGLPRQSMTVVFVIATLLLQVFVPYHVYVSYLKWLSFSLLAYAGVLVTVHVPWGEVALRTIWPKFDLTPEAATVVVGVFGTTISPYLFFWQASEEVEEMRKRHDQVPLIQDSRLAHSELRRIRWDTWSGMFYSDLTAYFIILTTAVTLHMSGVTTIETAAQAAAALRPLAGNFAFVIFALGILGVGLIGVPVLAGSAAYAVSEALNWKWGLELRARDAGGFYGVIAVSVAAALLIQYSPVSPMRALFWSAVLNGIVAAPLIVVVILLASSRKVMGDFVVSRPVVFLAWVAALVMGLSAALMFLPTGAYHSS